jgi:hypothetical protein
MAVLLFANLATATLAGAISNTSTTVTLQAGEGALFPNPSAGQQFVGTFVDAATGLLDEIVTCTARSTDILTIVRAQEGTTGLNCSAGDFFSNLWTAGQAGAMLQASQAPTANVYTGPDTGAADAYVVATVTPPLTSLSDGNIIVFTPQNTATGPSTLNVATISPGSALLGPGGAAIQNGQVVANVPVMAVWRAANTSWYMLSTVPPAPGQLPETTIAGFTPTFTNVTPGSAAVTVNAGQATDSTGSVMLQLLATSTAWHVTNGNAANGFQGGTTLPGNATIHWAICQGSAGQCIFADTQLPVRSPTGYTTYQRRIFSAPTDGSGNIQAYVGVQQAGGALYCAYSNSGGGYLDVSASTLTTANRTLYALTVPAAGISVQWQGRMSQNSSTTGSVIVTSPSEHDVAPGNLTTAPLFDYIDTGSYQTPPSGQRSLFTNFSGQLGARASVGSMTWNIFTTGFLDPRLF